MVLLALSAGVSAVAREDSARAIWTRRHRQAARSRHAAPALSRFRWRICSTKSSRWIPTTRCVPRAQRIARERGITNIEWRFGGSKDLSPALGRFRLAHDGQLVSLDGSRGHARGSLSAGGSRVAGSRWWARALRFRVHLLLPGAPRLTTVFKRYLPGRERAWEDPVRRPSNATKHSSNARASKISSPTRNPSTSNGPSTR